MPKSKLEWAIEAYVRCVEALEPLGSDNKRFRVQGDISAGEYGRRIQRDTAIKTNLKPHQPTGAKATMAKVVAYGLKAAQEPAGSCFEHAAVAAAFLHARAAPRRSSTWSRSRRWTMPSWCWARPGQPPASIPCSSPNGVRGR